MSKLLPILCLLVACCGCIHQKVGVNYSVPPQSVTKIEFVNCDTASPPHCQKVVLTYRKNSEQLVAK